MTKVECIKQALRSEFVEWLWTSYCAWKQNDPFGCKETISFRILPILFPLLWVLIQWWYVVDLLGKFLDFCSFHVTVTFSLWLEEQHQKVHNEIPSIP